MGVWGRALGPWLLLEAQNDGRSRRGNPECQGPVEQDWNGEQDGKLASLCGFVAVGAVQGVGEGSALGEGWQSCGMLGWMIPPWSSSAHLCSHIPPPRDTGSRAVLGHI